MSNIQRIKKLTANLLFLLFVICSANSQENTGFLRWDSGIGGYKSSLSTFLSPDEKNKMDLLWNEIGEDLKTEKNDFAGTFVSLGDKEGYFLRWSLKKGFILITYYDESLITDFSYGEVSIDNNLEVTFKPKRDLSYGRVFKKTPRIWIPVVKSNYFVPKEKVAWFGDYYGGFGDFNGYPRNLPCDGCSFFASQIEKERNSNTKNFLAPPKYLKFIKKPINAEIILVGKRQIVVSSITSCCGSTQKSSATFAVINKGRKDKVTEGLLFLLINAGDKFYQVLKVTKVNENSSEAIVLRTIDKNNKDAYEEYDEKTKDFVRIALPKLSKGIKVTTSPIE